MTAWERIGLGAGRRDEAPLIGKRILNFAVFLLLPHNPFVRSPIPAPSNELCNQVIAQLPCEHNALLLESAESHAVNFALITR